MREDFALPFFAIHLWLLARTARRPKPATACALGLATLAALATWHAMGLILALEGALWVVWTLRRGRSPLEHPLTWLMPATCLAGASSIPVIAERAGWTTPALACLIALWSSGLVTTLRGDRRRVRVVTLTVLAFLLLLGSLGEAGAHMAHTSELLLAKLRFLGRLPLDPERLSPTVRLMWQGPFATAGPGALVGGLGLLQLVSRRERIQWLPLVPFAWGIGVVVLYLLGHVLVRTECMVTGWHRVVAAALLALAAGGLWCGLRVPRGPSLVVLHRPHGRDALLLALILVKVSLVAYINLVDSVIDADATHPLGYLALAKKVGEGIPPSQVLGDEPIISPWGPLFLAVWVRAFLER